MSHVGLTDYMVIGRYICKVNIITFNLSTMDTKDLKNKAHELQNKVQDKVGDFLNNPKVKKVNDKGEELIEKGKDWFENGKGAELIDKGKDMLGTAKDKLEDFVEDKTDGQGIFGFGKKDD